MIIIQDVWYDWGFSDNIIKYCIDNNIQYLIMNKDDINGRDFNDILFCNSEIIYQMKPELYYDTYDSRFKSLFKRDIVRFNLNDIIFTEPFFMKPIKDKLFDGVIINDENELIKYKTLYNNSDVYLCNVINIISEYRILIGNNKIYGIGLIDGLELEIDDFFLNQIIISDYLCIDIGYNNDIGWFIVEINPPFSLEEYNIDMEKYINFCEDSLKSLLVSTKIINLI